MADLARHPDVLDLAEYAEGLLDPSRQSAVDQHVRECPDCAATLADLAGLPETLAQVSVPPLPTEVAERIDRAIAAEASARAATPPAPATSTVVPLRPRRRWLAPVLAAAAVIGVIGIAVPALEGDSSDDGGDSAASTSDESGQSLDAEHGGGDSGTAPDAAPGDLPALSSDTFARDVADAFLPSKETSAYRTKTEGQLDATNEDAIRQGLCPTPAGADLSSGRVEAITLDGAPADLLITQTGKDIEAIAFTCDRTGAQVLASATLSPR